MKRADRPAKTLPAAWVEHARFLESLGWGVRRIADLYSDLRGANEPGIDLAERRRRVVRKTVIYNALKGAP